MTNTELKEALEALRDRWRNPIMAADSYYDGLEEGRNRCADELNILIRKMGIEPVTDPTNGNEEK